MNLHKLILTNNDCYKAGKTITPKGIMVHSTGANNPNLKRYVGRVYHNALRRDCLSRLVAVVIGKY